MPNKIEIPPKLKDILDEDYTLSGFVMSSVSEFSPWLKENNVKFYEKYGFSAKKKIILPEPLNLPMWLMVR